MKQTSTILSVIALVAVAALGIFILTDNGGKKAAPDAEGVEAVAQKGAVVYFNLDRVLK